MEVEKPPFFIGQWVAFIQRVGEVDRPGDCWRVGRITQCYKTHNKKEPTNAFWMVTMDGTFNGRAFYFKPVCQNCRRLREDHIASTGKCLFGAGVFDDGSTTNTSG